MGWLNIEDIIIHLATHHHLSLSLGHGGEHVVSKHERALLIIPVVDNFVLLLEDLKPEIILIFGTIAKSFGCNMSLEFLMKLLRNFIWLEKVLEAEHGSSFRKLHHI